MADLGGLMQDSVFNFEGMIRPKDETSLLSYFEILREQGVHDGEKRALHDATFRFYAWEDWRCKSGRSLPNGDLPNDWRTNWSAVKRHVDELIAWQEWAPPVAPFIPSFSKVWQDPLCPCELCSDLIRKAGQDVENLRQQMLGYEAERQESVRARERVVAERAARSAAWKSRPTSIYLMRNDRNGFTKIGISANPRAREKTLQAEDPQTALLFHFPATADIEKALHGRYEALRVRGEWFHLTDQHVEEIRQEYIR